MTRSRSLFEPVRLFAVTGSLFAVASLVGVVLYLTIGSSEALAKEGWRFFTESSWAYRRESFGAAAMLYGSAAVSLIALMIAVPLGLGAALFISEVAAPKVRLPLKLLVELLAGIPSVVYGLLGVLFLRDWMATGFEKLQLEAWSGDTLLTAGILLAVMVLPTMTTLSDDALQSVSSRLRDASRGLGLTQAESVLSVVVPKAMPGIIGAALLSLGRALGETIAVFLVVGRADNRLPESLLSLQPLIDAGQTLTSKLGGAETNIAVGDSLHTSAILALGLTLLVIVLAVTVAADVFRTRMMRRQG